MQFLQITLTGWVALTIALSMVFLAGLMFILGQRRFQYIWGVFCVAIAIWAWGFYNVSLTHEYTQAQFWWRISYIGIILNPFLYFLFALEFAENKIFLKYRNAITAAIIGAAALFLVLDLGTKLIIDKVTVLFGQLYYNTPPGDGYIYFMVLFPTLICVSLFLIIREFRRRTDDPLFRQRAIYFLVASVIAYIGGGMNFLPVYGIQVNPVTNFAVAFGAILIAYAILRRGLFDVKIVMAQFLTLILAVFALVRLIISQSAQELMFNILMLGVTLAVGIYLILSVRKEVEQRERIQKLAKELEETNKRQETLIRFVGHEVKAFLTKAKSTFSLLAEGELGTMPDTAKPFIIQAQDAVDQGVLQVTDILKASNLKKGTVEFKMEAFDLKPLIVELVQKEMPAARAKGLDLSLVANDAAYPAKGDRTELGDHVFRNLIENAVNYTPSGSIAVSLKREGGKYIFAVKDTGVGITEEDKKRLFTEGGHGKDSQKINVHSTGYGLYIAKSVVERHGGTIRAESEGTGKGSTFVVELPISS